MPPPAAYCRQREAAILYAMPLLLQDIDDDGADDIFTLRIYVAAGASAMLRYATIRHIRWHTMPHILHAAAAICH